MEDKNFVKSLNSLNFQINYWFEIITSPIGVCLNLISMYIFSRPNLNKTNMGFFYINITFWNIVVLLFSFFLINSKITLGYELSITSDAACASIWFIRRVSRLFPPWIEVLVTIDRYLFICYSNRFKFIRSKQNLVLIIMGIFVFLILQSIPNLLFTTSLSIINNTNQTNSTIIDIKCSGTRDLGIISDTINLFIKTIIPTIIMLILSILLIRKIRRQRSKLSNAKVRDFNILRETHFTISILGMNMMFLVLNLPLSLMNPLKSIYNYINYQDNTFTVMSALVNLVYTITFQISNLYYTTMFFSFLVFNKVYLSEILYLTGITKKSTIGTSAISFT
jgi:hypothetical protein